MREIPLHGVSRGYWLAAGPRRDREGSRKLARPTDQFHNSLEVINLLLLVASGQLACQRMGHLRPTSEVADLRCAHFKPSLWVQLEPP
jgi:hypothetical protein